MKVSFSPNKSNTVGCLGCSTGSAVTNESHQPLRRNAKSRLQHTFACQPLLVEELWNGRSLLRIAAQATLHALNHRRWHLYLQMIQSPSGLRWSSIRVGFRWNCRDSVLREVDNMRQVGDRFHLVVYRKVLERRVTVNHLVKDTS